VSWLQPIPDLTDPRAYTGYPALQGVPPPAIAQAMPALQQQAQDLGGPTGSVPPAIAQSVAPAAPPIAQPSAIQQPTAPQGSTEYYLQRQQKIQDQQAYERGQTFEKQFEQAQLKPWQDLGTGGKIARVAETIGGVMFPGIVSRIPGSPINLGLRQQEAEKELATMEQLQNQQMEARARMIQAEQAKHQLVTTPEGTFSVGYDPSGQPTVSELRTPTGRAMYPAGKTMQEQAYDYYMHGGPQGGPRLDASGKPYDPIGVIEGVTGAKLGDDRKQAMNAYKQANPGANDYQAFVATEPQKQGTQSEQLVDQYFKDHPEVQRNFENESKVAGQVAEMLQKPPQQMILVPNAQGGLDVQIAKPGMTLPTEFQTFTGEQSTQKGIQGAKAAQAYATAYMQSGHFTGPGDEALMEQYFELAKPDSGFRMSQPQIDMLNNARNIMGGMQARARHWFTPSAPWFSDEQRRQIVETMGMIQEAKTTARGGTVTQPAPGRAAGGGGGMKYQKGDQFVANGRLFEFQGGDVKNWKDTGPAPAGAPPGIYIPPVIQSPVLGKP